MVKYDRLWETMKRKNVSQYRLINHYKISAGQLGRLRKNRFDAYAGNAVQDLRVRR